VRLQVLPLFVSGETVIVATARPSNVFVKDSTAAEIGRRVSFVSVDERELLDAIELTYSAAPGVELGHPTPIPREIPEELAADGPEPAGELRCPQCAKLLRTVRPRTGERPFIGCMGYPACLYRRGLPDF
jgi:hypothetical protein